MKPLTLRSLVFAGMGLLSLFGLVLAITLFSLTDHIKHTAAVSRMAMQGIVDTEELQKNLLLYKRHTYIARETGSEEFYEKSKIHKESINQFLTEIEMSADNAEELEIVKEARKATEAFLQRYESMETLENPLTAYKMVTEEFESLLALLERLTVLNISQAQENHESVNRSGSYYRYLALFSCLGMLVMLLVLSYWFRISLYKPLVDLAAHIRRFSTENSSEPAPLQGPQEIQNITATFNEMALRLANQREAQLGFLASVAHDLRNPLNAIRMSVDLLTLSSQSADPGPTEILPVIKRQVVQLDRMVGDLLDTTRIQAGQLELLEKPTDLEELVRDCVTLFQTTSKKHHIRFVAHQRPLHAICDPLRIGQVLNNLISNAIKYSPSGGPVDIQAGIQGNEVLISVTDKGLGITKSELARLFEPFRRGERSRSAAPGIGLGLAVSRRIIKAHGGRIEVVSSPDMGSTFTVWLPLKNCNLEPKTSEKSVS